MCNKNIEKAKQYINNQKLSKAESILTEAAKSIPKDYSVFFELGKVYLMKKNHQKAIVNLNKSLALKKDNINAKLLLAKAFKCEGNLKEALDILKGVFNTENGDEKIAQEICLLYSDIGDLKNSVKYLKQAFEKKDETEGFTKYLFDISWPHLKMIKDLNVSGNYSKALAEIERIKSFMPDGGKKLKNILQSEKDIALKEKYLNSLPRSLNVILTQHCNIRCIMCRTINISRPLSITDKIKEEIIEILPYLEKVVWQGGEPFLYEHLEELVDSAYTNNVAQNIITNGLLITSDFAHKLVKYGVELTFSVDGVTRDVYEKIRAGASWENLLKKINLVNKLRKKINQDMQLSMNVLIMPNNYEQLPGFMDFAHRYGFERVFFNLVDSTDLNKNTDNIFDFKREKEKVNLIKNKLREMYAKSAHYGIKVKSWIPLELSDDRKQIEIIKNDSEGENCPEEVQNVEGNGESSLFCHAPWHRLFIYASLEVLPDCQCIKTIGSLERNSLKKLWNSKGMITYREKIINGNFKGICNPECIYGKISDDNLKKF